MNIPPDAPWHFGARARVTLEHEPNKKLAESLHCLLSGRTILICHFLLFWMMFVHDFHPFYCWVIWLFLIDLLLFSKINLFLIIYILKAILSLWINSLFWNNIKLQSCKDSTGNYHPLFTWFSLMLTSDITKGTTKKPTLVFASIN